MIIKTQTEIEHIRAACAISDRLHLKAMAETHEGLTELDLAEKIQRSFQLSRASDWAYPVIVGSGERATILHAKPSARALSNGELLLLDAGVKFEGLCSDITRTWPVDQKFSKNQREIYKIVLRAQKEVIKQVRPNRTLPELHQVCVDYLTEGLLSAGIIKKEESIKPYFPHRTSHWIGREVHDQCPYFYDDKTPVSLAAGMCFTVEPGLYFENKSGPYAGIGVRIEDVILVTENGCEVLSHAPKELKEVEEVRSWRSA